jgi:predicted small lipoprotein YifL
MIYKKLLAILFLSFAVCSCGIKGDLYLPDKQEKSE